MKQVSEFQILNQTNNAIYHDICDSAHLSWLWNNDNIQTTIRVCVLNELLYGFAGRFEFPVQHCRSVCFIKSHENPGHNVLIEHYTGDYYGMIKGNKNYFRNRISIFDIKGNSLRNFEIPHQVQKFSSVRPSPSTGDIYFFFKSIAHVVSQDGAYLRLFRVNRSEASILSQPITYLRSEKSLTPKFNFDDSNTTRMMLSWSENDDLFYSDIVSNGTEIVKFDKVGNFIKKVLFPFKTYCSCAIPNFPDKLLLATVNRTSHIDIILKDLNHPEDSGVVIQSNVYVNNLSIGPNGKLTVMSAISIILDRTVKFYE